MRRIGRLPSIWVVWCCCIEMEKSTDRRSRSLWMDIDVAPNARSLQGGTECDVVVIGSGIAGISTAYELAIEGQRVIVVDRGKIAGGITARTSAHLAPLCDDLTSAMIRLRWRRSQERPSR
jgi:heterodisulfide reductase subunit A-like polyferredoxin